MSLWSMWHSLKMMLFQKLLLNSTMKCSCLQLLHLQDQSSTAHAMVVSAGCQVALCSSLKITVMIFLKIYFFWCGKKLWFLMWHMPHGITLHLALKNSNCYYLHWSSSTNLQASTTAGPNCNYSSSEHHHIPSRRPSFMQPLALLLPSLMHFSQPLHCYQVHSLQVSLS